MFCNNKFTPQLILPFYVFDLSLKDKLLQTMFLLLMTGRRILKALVRKNFSMMTNDMPYKGATQE